MKIGEREGEKVGIRKVEKARNVVLGWKEGQVLFRKNGRRERERKCYECVLKLREINSRNTAE